ncbi:Piwi domain protein [Aphelenchoides besseyi]|nr:Piwi domain protein [Aphelenchoides besseyi]
MSQGYNRQFAGSHIGRGGNYGRSNYQGDRSGRGNSSRGVGGPLRASTAPFVPPGSLINGRSNAFEIQIKPGSVVYRYDVEITKIGEGQRTDKSLTKQNDPGLRTAQKECCADIIECLFNLTNGFGSQSHYVYDGKNTLYSTKAFAAINNQEISAELLKRRAAVFVRNSTVRISMTPNGKQPMIDYSRLDTALVDEDARQADHSVRSFLELATTQYVCNTDQYQRVAAGTIFEAREAELTEGMSIRVGVKKGVRVTEHTKQQPKAFLIADMKRTAFFSTGTLDRVYTRMVRGHYDRNLFNRFYKGVRMCIDYDPSRTFIFDSLTDRNVNDSQYRVDNLTLPQFFQQKRRIILQAANLPGAHPKQPKGQQVIYPLEVIRPVPGQLVPVEKLTDQAIRKLLLENAVPPDTRMGYINQHVRQIAEQDGAAFLQHFGLALRLNTNDITIKTSAMPSIMVGQNQTIHTQANGSWFSDAVRCNFLEGSNRLKNWLVVHDRQVESNEVRSFTKALMNAGSRSGMTIPEPLAFISTDVTKLEKVFADAKERKIQFILYTDDLRIKSHGKLKLLEAYYKMSINNLNNR